MPVKKVKGGYKWGDSGKVYKKKDGKDQIRHKEKRPDKIKFPEQKIIRNSKK